MAAAEFVGAFLKTTWPVMVVAGGGLLAWGGLNADVSALKRAAEVTTTDHDRIVRMETKQDVMVKDVAEMKQDIKDIAQAVK